MSIIQCQTYCEARPGCNAIEFWEGGSRYCYECTDTSKITPYTYSNDRAYPVYVWVKSKLTGSRVAHLFYRHEYNNREISLVQWHYQVQSIFRKIYRLFFTYAFRSLVLLYLHLVAVFVINFRWLHSTATFITFYPKHSSHVFLF